MTNLIKFKIGNVVIINHDMRSNFTKKYTIVDIKDDYCKLLRVAVDELNEVLDNIPKDCLILDPETNSWLNLGDRVCFIFNPTKSFIVSNVDKSLPLINIIAEDLSCSFNMVGSNVLKKYED